jgi:hypothetical protein
LTVKLYPDRIAICFDTQLIARHTRCYSRHLDIEDPEHAKALIARRTRAREQRLMLRFLVLSPDAQAYWGGPPQQACRSASTGVQAIMSEMQRNLPSAGWCHVPKAD